MFCAAANRWLFLDCPLRDPSAALPPPRDASSVALLIRHLVILT